MEQSTTEYPFKIGDRVTIITDRIPKYVGLTGEIAGYFSSTSVAPLTEIDGCYVKMDIKIESGVDNNIEYNTRAMFFRELVLDKAHIINAILNDL